MICGQDCSKVDILNNLINHMELVHNCYDVDLNNSAILFFIMKICFIITCLPFQYMDNCSLVSQVFFVMEICFINTSLNILVLGCHSVFQICYEKMFCKHIFKYIGIGMSFWIIIHQLVKFSLLWKYVS